MNNDRDLMQEALEALTYTGPKYIYSDTIEALRARLSQPEQEPFEYWNAVEGWVKIDEVRQHFDTTNCGTIYKHEGEGRIPLYAEPPQREWVGLTDEELEFYTEELGQGELGRGVLRAVVDFLREKNT